MNLELRYTATVVFTDKDYNDINKYFQALEKYRPSHSTEDNLKEAITEQARAYKFNFYFEIDSYYEQIKKWFLEYEKGEKN